LYKQFDYVVKLPKKDQGRSLPSGKYDTACFCQIIPYTFYHFRLSVNHEFETARMWISSVNREKKTARKFPGLQYDIHKRKQCSWHFN